MRSVDPSSFPSASWSATCAPLKNAERSHIEVAARHSRHTVFWSVYQARSINAR
jgi:hypothetical protein